MLIPCSKEEFFAQIAHLFIFNNPNPLNNSNLSDLESNFHTLTETDGSHLPCKALFFKL